MNFLSNARALFCILTISCIISELQGETFLQKTSAAKKAIITGTRSLGTKVSNRWLSLSKKQRICLVGATGITAALIIAAKYHASGDEEDEYVPQPQVEKPQAEAVSCAPFSDENQRFTLEGIDANDQYPVYFTINIGSQPLWSFYPPSSKNELQAFSREVTDYIGLRLLSNLERPSVSFPYLKENELRTKSITNIVFKGDLYPIGASSHALAAQAHQIKFILVPTHYEITETPGDKNSLELRQEFGLTVAQFTCNDGAAILPLKTNILTPVTEPLYIYRVNFPATDREQISAQVQAMQSELAEKALRWSANGIKNQVRGVASAELCLENGNEVAKFSKPKS